MRTTIDLDEALLERLREEARQEGVSFRAILHRVILEGLNQMPQRNDARYVPPSVSFGLVRNGIDLVKARHLADDLEDEEIMRKMHDGR